MNLSKKRTLKIFIIVMIIFCVISIMRNKVYAATTSSNTISFTEAFSSDITVGKSDEAIIYEKTGERYEVNKKIDGSSALGRSGYCLIESSERPYYTRYYTLDYGSDITFKSNAEKAYVYAAGNSGNKYTHKDIQGYIWGYNSWERTPNFASYNEALWVAAEEYEDYINKLKKFDIEKAAEQLVASKTGNEIRVENIDNSVATEINLTSTSSDSSESYTYINGDLRRIERNSRKTVSEVWGNITKVIAIDNNGQSIQIPNNALTFYNHETGDKTDLPAAGVPLLDVVINTDLLSIEPKKIQFVYEDTYYIARFLHFSTPSEKERIIIPSGVASCGCATGNCGKAIPNTIYDSKGHVIGTETLRCGQSYGGWEREIDHSYQPIGIPYGEKIPGERIIGIELGDEISIDLSLRKFITGISGTKINSREPQVDTTPLKNQTGTTAIYNHPKTPLEAKIKGNVEYTIRVYNEGGVDAYAGEIKDHLPSKLEFASGVVDGIDYKWTVSADGRTLTTEYLKDTKLKKYDGGNSLDYADVKVILKVKENALKDEILVNIAEISKYMYDDNGNKVEVKKDVDSSSDNVKLPSEDEWSSYEGKVTIKTTTKTEKKETKKVKKSVDLVARAELMEWAGFTEYHWFQFARQGVPCPKCKIPCSAHAVMAEQFRYNEHVYIRVRTGSNETEIHNPYEYEEETTTIIEEEETTTTEYEHEDDEDFERVKVLLITDIAGTVWLDGVEGKQDERDGKLTERDQKLENIRVLLYEIGADGKEKFIEETKTDSKGNYIFKDKEVDKKYLIRFEYLGQQYIPVVVTKLNSGKYTSQDSAGEEKAADRNELNAKFYEIVKGTAKNKNGENTIGLKYSKDTAAHKSTLIRDDDFNSKTKIKANTVEFSGSEAYVGYINLGLIERAQIDLRIDSAVKNVEMSINGVTETYTRDSEGTPFADVDEISLKYDKALPDVVYNMAIYHSDYTYRIDDYKDTEGGTPDSASPLKVYVTYVIKVENTSSKNGKVSELKVWYPEEYNMNKSWYARSKTATDGNGTSWNETGRTAGQNLKGDSVQYKIATTNSIKNETVSPDEPVYLFIRFEVGTNADGSIRLGRMNVLSEITGYTTEEGLIDINSEPGNFEVTTRKKIEETYEDDTAVAISLDINAPEDLKRTMTGYVWEDIAKDTDADGVKIGNGMFDSGEGKQDGVTVQLIELAEKDGKTYEYIWQETTTGSDKVSYMDRNGNVKSKANARTVTAETGSYTFTDYIPGKYIVRFIYGEIIKDNKVILSGQDYKSTKYTGYGEDTSSAKDNKERRLEVMSYPGEQTAETVKILANTGESAENANTLKEKTWMNADTVDAMAISLSSSDPGHKVNFGLVERPKAILKVSTEIEKFKITNKNVILVDTTQNIEIGVKKVGDKQWYVELDDELINGAIVEAEYKVKVANVGDKDTWYNYFEGDDLGGKVKDENGVLTGERQRIEIRTSAPLVYDTPRKMGAEEQDGWIKAEGTVLSTTRLNQLLKPTESTEEIELKLSKVLSIGGNGDLDVVNDVEIVNRYNQVGRRVDIQDGADEGKITITDPAGKPRVQYEIWIATLAIFTTGIVLVKKFAVKKEETKE